MGVLCDVLCDVSCQMLMWYLLSAPLLCLCVVCIFDYWAAGGAGMGWYKDITITRYWLYFDEQEREEERAVRDTRDNAVMTAAAAGIILPIMFSSLPIATFQF